MATSVAERSFFDAHAKANIAGKAAHVKHRVDLLRTRMKFDKKQKCYTLNSANNKGEITTPSYPLAGLVGHLKRTAMPHLDAPTTNPMEKSKIFRNIRFVSSTSVGKRIDREVKTAVAQKDTHVPSVSETRRPMRKAKDQKKNHHWTTAYIGDCAKLGLTLIASQIPVWDSQRRVGTEIDDLAMCPDGRLVCIERKSGYSSSATGPTHAGPPAVTLCNANLSVRTSFPSTEYALHQLQAASGAQMWNNLLGSDGSVATSGLDALRIVQSCVVYVTGRSATPWRDAEQMDARNPFQGQQLISKTKKNVVTPTKLKCTWAWTPAAIWDGAQILFPRKT